MPRNDDEEESGGGAPEWMCTFSDMMSLLLCFFVLLFALSTIEKKKLIEAAGSLRAAFGGLPAPYSVENIPDQNTEEQMSRKMQPERRRSYAKDELRREIERRFQSMKLQDTVQVTGTEQGLTFRLSGDVAFEQGSAELTSDALVALSAVANELNQFPDNPVKIDGHTDNKPSQREEGNWLLSADRAYSVMEYLTEYGSIDSGQVDESRISYEAFADTKPVEGLNPNNAIGRAQNRRVDITLIQTDQGQGTFFVDPNVKNPRSPIGQISKESDES